MRVDETGKTVTFEGCVSKTFGEGDVLSVDGETGEVIGRAVRLGKPSSGATGDLATITAWADEYKNLRVLANADTPEDAATAMENGAEGIGLTRTEHMWFETAERTRAIRTHDPRAGRCHAPGRARGYARVPARGLRENLSRGEGARR